MILTTEPVTKWQTTIGKLCDEFGGDVQTGPFGSQLHASDYSPEGTPVAMPRDLIGGRIVCNKIARVGMKHVNKLKRHVLEVGDIVFSRRGDITRFAVVTQDEAGWLCGTGCIRIRLNCPDVEVGYSRRYLEQESVGKWLLHQAKGITMPNLNTTIVRDLPFVYPPLSEQKRIAEILDRAEALRAKRRAALALLDELTQSIFLDMFGDPVSNPKGWDDSKTLADVASIGSGITKGRRTKDPVRSVPYMAVVNVQDKMLDLSVVKTIDATDKEIDRYRLKTNDLLLTEGGDADKLGRGTLWSDELPECIHQNHIFRVRLETSDVSPLFLNWLVGGQRGKSFFLRQAKQTTGIATINMTQLKSFPMLIPPLKLQKEFASRLLRMEGMRSAQDKSLAELDQLFASLQHRAFRGEL